MTGPTAKPHDPVPEAVTLALAGLGEDHFPVRVGVPQPGPDESWHRFDELTAHAVLCDRLPELAEERYGGDRQIATVVLAARLLSPLARLAARPVLEQGRAVEVDADELWLRRHPRGWHNAMSLVAPRLAVTAGDPLADVHDVEVVDHLDIVRDRAMTQTLALASPVVARLREVGSVGERALWGQFADALIGAVARRHDGRGDAEAARAEAAPLLDADDRLWVDPEIARVDVDGRVGLAWRRGSCCLVYRMDGSGYCTGCPLISRDEWWERSVASVRERATEASA